MPRVPASPTRLRPYSLRHALLATAAALLCTAATAASGLAQPRAEPPPTLQCPTGESQCTYTERRLALDGYSYQTMMLSGGADWSTQFWVRDAQGHVLLAIPPLRGSAYLAVQRADDSQTHAPPTARVISYHYAPGDPAVAPSGLSRTTYRYDAGTDTLVPDASVVQPLATPETIRQSLMADGWTLVFPTE
jgi:hypothetical protein